MIEDQPRDVRAQTSSAAVHDAAACRLLEVAEALRVSEARYAYVVEQAPDGIMLADAAGRIRDVNARACTLLRFTRAQLLQRHLSDLIVAEDLAARPVNRPLMASMATFRTQRRMTRGDGTQIDVDVNVSRPGGGMMLGIVRDISEQRPAAHPLGCRARRAGAGNHRKRIDGRPRAGQHQPAPATRPGRIHLDR